MRPAPAGRVFEAPGVYTLTLVLATYYAPFFSLLRDHTASDCLTVHFHTRKFLRGTHVNDHVSGLFCKFEVYRFLRMHGDIYHISSTCESKLTSLYEIRAALRRDVEARCNRSLWRPLSVSSVAYRCRSSWALTQDKRLHDAPKNVAAF